MTNDVFPNQLSRDTALLKILVKVATTEYFVARIYANIYDLDNQQIDALMRKIEQEEKDKVFLALAKEFEASAQNNQQMKDQHPK